MSRKTPGVYILAARSAAYRLMPPDAFRALHLELAPNTSMDPLDAVAKLIALGYERVDRCEGEAQVSFKGGVLDISPAGSDCAIRARFFGDDIRIFQMLRP
ncbi:MAG: hypothetical protein MZU97_27180 [Bacillus subtilis]|nr:hypothetical protein [Bacillus subtilis]